MYTVTKRIEVSGSHQLKLPYESKCKNLHGHNWIINVTLKSETLDENGMILDFTKIKEKDKRMEIILTIVGLVFVLIGVILIYDARKITKNRFKNKKNI